MPYNKFPKPISEENERASYDILYSIQRLFEKEIEFQRKFETYKQNFSEYFQGSYEAVFTILTGIKTEEISIENILNFFNKNSTRISTSSLNGLFKRLDKDNDGIISYDDFLEVFKITKPFARLSSTKNQSQISFKQKDSIKENIYHNYEIQKSANHKKNILDKGIKKLLIGLIEFEKSLENLRNSLALRIDFTIELAFHFFDKRQKGFISELDFHYGLEKLQIRTSANVIFLIYRHYDKDNDGILRLCDFYNMLMPKKATYSGLIKDRMPFTQFSIETAGMLSDMFKSIINIEVNAEFLRQNFMVKSFSLQNLFDYIDSKHFGYLTINEFRNILINNRIQPTKRDLAGLIERFDRNKDGKISFSEFVQEILPRSPN